MRDAIWHDGRCTWLGWVPDSTGASGGPVVAALGPDLYFGTAGIGLYLALLTTIGDDPLQRRCAVGALRQAVARAAEPKAAIGLYDGIAGVAHAALVGGSALGREELVAGGLDLLGPLAERPIHGPALDMFGGRAGAIVVLLDAADRFDRPDLLDTAVRYGRELAAAARRDTGHACWDTVTVPVVRPLLGYSHGASGIACALIALAEVTGDGEFRALGLEGLAYEHELIDRESGAWPDFRAETAGRPPMNAWCHGAPGAALALLRVRSALGTSAGIEDDLELALSATAGWLDGVEAPNYSLCHGAGGNAEVLLLAAELLGRGELRERAVAVAAEGIARYHERAVPWPCGLPPAATVPGLMVGTAGIGHFLLRAHDPAAIPSILSVWPESLAMPGRRAATAP